MEAWVAVVVVIEDNLPSQGSPVLLVQMSSILCHFCVRGTNKLTSDLAFYLYLSWELFVWKVVFLKVR